MPWRSLTAAGAALLVCLGVAGCYDEQPNAFTKFGSPDEIGDPVAGQGADRADRLRDLPRHPGRAAGRRPRRAAADEMGAAAGTTVAGLLRNTPADR